MKNALPEYHLAALQGTHVEQLGQFEEILEEAEKKGIANRTADSAEGAYDLEAQRVRIYTIATRLHLLGYLDRKISPQRLANKLNEIRSAVGRFQKDADLKLDHWVGDVTWYALDELVSFESEFTSDKWFKDGQVRPEVEPAMQRATRLRLWCLGLCRSKPKRDLVRLNLATFRSFEAIALAFRMRSSDFKARFDQSTIELLFDQDQLTQAAADRANPSHTEWLLNTSKDKQFREQRSRAFIINCAKIELWLLGYKVKIDGSTTYTAHARNELYLALSQYYQQFDNRDIEEADELAKRMTPKLFIGLAEASRQSSSYNEDDTSGEIAQEISTEADVEEAWTYVKSKSLRLWDGLKRIWRWIKKLGKKALFFIRNNIFKGFFRFATKAFKIVVRGMSAVANSIGIYTSGKLDLQSISFRFSKDLDTLALVSSNAAVDLIQPALSALERQSKAFRVACRIITLIFELFKAQTQSLLGWAKLLISLVRGYSKLKTLYIDFKALA